MKEELFRTPMSVRWCSADVPDGGGVELIDRDGYPIAFAETRQHTWRSSQQGRQFLYLAKLINIAAELP